MENTLENKLKFFASYFGQEILCHPDYITETYSNVNVYLYGGSKIDDGYFLALKPLSNITDEDLQLIMGDDVMNPNIDCTYTNEIGGLKLSQLVTADFLRSKGYVLPWMGLSVDKLIEYGWVKLRSK